MDENGLRRVALLGSISCVLSFVYNSPKISNLAPRKNQRSLHCIRCCNNKIKRPTEPSPSFSSYLLLCRNSITHGLSTAHTTARSVICKRWLSINSSSLGRSCTCKSPRTSGCTTGAAARNNNGVISASVKVVTGEDRNFRVSVDAYRVSLTLHRS